MFMTPMNIPVIFLVSMTPMKTSVVFLVVMTLVNTSCVFVLFLVLSVYCLLTTHYDEGISSLLC